MNHRLVTAHALALLALPGSVCLLAADLPPDPGTTIPQSSQRPVVVVAGKGSAKPAVPAFSLPPGFTLEVAAAAPLVTHPIAGCLDDRGRLFLGDAVGVNWNKAQLEAGPPNRVLMLEDTDKDGVYDKSTVFADKMTFPQGAQWLDGSLYIMSPPGLWKLTDTNGDGVADERKMLVTGFDYTGNAADVHGPFLHPNGRLYWCHGRKGYKVPDAKGEIVHEGRSSGIWSCKPDGSDVQWHSLLAGDNPVEVDFTPDGDVIGVQNLYYSQPRGDTIVHWLYGGVYERADQMKVIAGLPRTLDTMPVMYNFGHVAVSGSCFWHAAGGLFAGARSAARPLHFMVTHFNTQRVVRMEMTPEGSSYKAVENEFLKLENPDAHFTDVMEAPDGSLLVVDTGGWFRIGCPSSLMAKPDVMGVVYRVRPTKAASPSGPWYTYQDPGTTAQALLRCLRSEQPGTRLRALARVAELRMEDAEVGKELVAMMARPMDVHLEHALIHAAKTTMAPIALKDLREAKDPVTLRRLLLSYVPDDVAATNLSMGVASHNMDSADEKLAQVALKIVTDHQDADEWVSPHLEPWLKEAQVPPTRLKALHSFCGALLGKPGAGKLLTAMLSHPSAAVRQTGLEVLASQPAGIAPGAWMPALENLLGDKNTNTSLVLDALKKVKAPELDGKLQAMADDAKRPLPLRLKALDAMKTRKVSPETFDLLRDVLINSTSAAARIQAATMLAAAPLTAEQFTVLAPVMAQVGPVEMKELLAIMRRTKDATVARAFATHLAQNPALISQQESIYRTAFSSQPPELFETIILPARQKAEVLLDAKKRQLGPLAERAASEGNAAAGKTHFAAGKGTCVACHRVGEVGRAIGPDLSKIGAIRSERDLLESILFPSQTLARDFEAHVLETADGQTMMGVVKSHTAEGLLVVDVAGQEKNISHGQIVSNTTLTTSLMPMGLDQTLPEKELLDLVAYLRSLK